MTANGHKKLCGAKTKKGKGPPCTRPAGWGTSHVGYGTCKLHGGSTPNSTKAAAKEEAAELAAMYGGPVEIDPMDALLQELYRTAGHVAWLETKVSGGAEDDLHGKVGAEGFGHDEEGNALQHHPRVTRSIWLELYHAEREHMTKVAKTCIDAGIDERRVRLAEQQGQLLAAVIAGILEDLGVDLNAAKTRKVIRDRLTSIAGEGRQLEEAKR